MILEYKNLILIIGLCILLHMHQLNTTEELLDRKVAAPV
jgi:hypothetical protein